MFLVIFLPHANKWVLPVCDVDAALGGGDGKKKTTEGNCCKVQSKRENSERIAHNYKAGDWITTKKPGILRKLSVARMGPFKVIKQHNNGTLSYEKEPFQPDRVSIRRCMPCVWKHPPVD